MGQSSCISKSFMKVYTANSHNGFLLLMLELFVLEHVLLLDRLAQSQMAFKLKLFIQF